MDKNLIHNLQSFIDRKYGEITVEEHPMFGNIFVGADGEAINVNSDVITLMEAVRVLKKLDDKN